MNTRLCLPAYAGVILQNKQQVFLIQRRNTNWRAGYWNFPGGLLEANESAKHAAIRETKEEIGVIIEPKSFEFVHLLHVHKNEHNTQDILGLYFRTNHWQGTPTNSEPAKITAAAWFDLDGLPENLTEHAQLAIQGLLKTQYYSESGW